MNIKRRSFIKMVSGGLAALMVPISLGKTSESISIKTGNNIIENSLSGKLSAKDWVQFIPVDLPKIRCSSNIKSVKKLGVGEYQIDFKKPIENIGDAAVIVESKDLIAVESKNSKNLTLLKKGERESPFEVINTVIYNRS